MSPPALPTLAHASARPLSALAVELARTCLDQLDGSNALTNEEVVHELRVATKRLRAAWHLAGALAAPGIARKRRQALRTLSAHLASSRDATVLDNLAQELAAKQTDGEIALAFDRLRDSLRDAESEPSSSEDREEQLSLLRDFLEAEIDAWESIENRDPAAWRRAIRHQLRKSRARAKRDSRLALDRGDAELWHDWRKTVKRLRYQREFVAAMQQRQPGPFDRHISRLGSALGDRNDLANLTALTDTLKQSGRLTGRNYGLIRKAIATDEQRIMHVCRRLGRRIFL